MKLRFHPAPGKLVRIPGAVAQVGVPAPYVGRVLADRAYVATAEPFEVEADTDAGRRLVKLARRDRSLLPADKATATAVGLPFVEVSLGSDGEFHRAASKSRKAD